MLYLGSRLPAFQTILTVVLLKMYADQHTKRQVHKMNRTPLEFQVSFIHFFKFRGLPEPLTRQEIPIPSVGGGGIMDIQYNTTLFYYASHTQQKLVSRWGVGKHISITVRTYIKCI